MYIKDIKNMQFNVRFSKYVVIFILLNEFVVLSYNQFCS